MKSLSIFTLCALFVFTAISVSYPQTERVVQDTSLYLKKGVLEMTVLSGVESKTKMNFAEGVVLNDFNVQELKKLFRGEKVQKLKYRPVGLPVTFLPVAMTKRIMREEGYRYRDDGYVISCDLHEHPEQSPHFSFLATLCEYLSIFLLIFALAKTHDLAFNSRHIITFITTGGIIIAIGLLMGALCGSMAGIWFSLAVTVATISLVKIRAINLENKFSATFALTIAVGIGAMYANELVYYGLKPLGSDVLLLLLLFLIGYLLTCIIGIGLRAMVIRKNIKKAEMKKALLKKMRPKKSPGLKRKRATKISISMLFLCLLFTSGAVAQIQRAPEQPTIEIVAPEVADTTFSGGYGFILRTIRTLAGTAIDTIRFDNGTSGWNLTNFQKLIAGEKLKRPYRHIVGLPVSSFPIVITTAVIDEKTIGYENGRVKIMGTTNIVGKPAPDAALTFVQLALLFMTIYSYAATTRKYVNWGQAVVISTSSVIILLVSMVIGYKLGWLSGFLVGSFLGIVMVVIVQLLHKESEKFEHPFSAIISIVISTALGTAYAHELTQLGLFLYDDGGLVSYLITYAAYCAVGIALMALITSRNYKTWRRKNKDLTEQLAGTPEYHQFEDKQS